MVRHGLSHGDFSGSGQDSCAIFPTLGPSLGHPHAAPASHSSSHIRSFQAKHSILQLQSFSCPPSHTTCVFPEAILLPVNFLIKIFMQTTTPIRDRLASRHPIQMYLGGWKESQSAFCRRTQRRQQNDKDYGGCWCLGRLGTGNRTQPALGGIAFP